MADAQYQIDHYQFMNQGHEFDTSVRKLVFPGYLILTQSLQTTNVEEQITAQLVLNQTYVAQTISCSSHSTKPPAHYTEASLIKALENEGIGRPSTYATITNTVLNRYYGIKEKTSLILTPLGTEVAQKLSTKFPKIMSFSYTRQMEDQLDQITENKTNWKDFLQASFDQFQTDLDHAKQTTTKPPVELADKLCPICQSPLIYRTSFKKQTQTKFIGCSSFPKCKYLENLDPAKQLTEKCPECTSLLMIKTNKKNQEFIGCSNFPQCKYLRSKTPLQYLDRNCPKCQNQLFIRTNRRNQEFIGCSGYPQCDYLENLPKKATS